MARKLKQLHYATTFSNASHNRDMATLAFKAGMTVDDIAAEWPAVFTASTEHGKRVLGQKYDSVMSDGRNETRFMVTRASVNEAIARRAAQTA